MSLAHAENATLPHDHRHDAHAPPPPHIRAEHKRLQKTDPDTLVHEESVLDLAGLSQDPISGISEHHRSRLRLLRTIPRTVAAEAFAGFGEGDARYDEKNEIEDEDERTSEKEDGIPVYTHSSVPGLQIIPSLLPRRTQKILLRRLLVRDLSDPAHNTNLTPHYALPYSSLSPSEPSFMSLSPSTTISPRDPSIHKPINLTQAFTRKLRWITLGGQYDWTRKIYPSSPPPDFPTDIATLLSSLFPEVTPQAAIANFYSPGDTLSPHRDVAEQSSRGLVSVSLGCEAVFVIGCEGREEVLSVRLRSGDVVVMSGEARWAWHSVPKVLKGSCPRWLEAWPGGDWDGWMQGKRVNLNVRQMWD